MQHIHHLHSKLFLKQLRKGHNFLPLMLQKLYQNCCRIFTCLVLLKSLTSSLWKIICVAGGDDEIIIGNYTSIYCQDFSIGDVDGSGRNYMAVSEVRPVGDQ